MKRFDMYLGRIAAAILLVTGGFLSSCEKNDDGPKLDKITVTVSEVSATATTAEFFGVVERQAKAPADAIVGFEYSNSEDFTGAAEVTGLAEQFTEKVTGLSVSTKYYYRTFVDKKGERTYGETASFTTNSASVSIVTVDASSTKAVIQCEVDPEVAGSSSLKAGIELSADVTFAAVMDITAKTISKEGAYTINIEDLALNTFYYIRPYIEDAGSRVYGTAKAFATTDVKVALDVNLNKALLRVVGSVYVDEADIDVITVGYQISTDSEFSASATTDVVIPASQYAYYDSGTMFNLRRPSTDYYYRSYVIFDGVYYYNNISRHTTDPLEVKGYNLLPATIKATSASAVPSVDAWDLTGVDEMGVAYSTDADFLTSRTGISYTAMQKDPFFGGYMLALSGLTPATGYYYTYYIKRGSEYEYGPAESVLSFATQPDATCISVNDVKPESYTPGKVVFTGSSKVSELAKTTYSIVTSLEYATVEDFSDKAVQEFTGNLSFQKNDLKPATTYYYRVALAYKDSKGDKTLYTAVKSFTTNEMVVSVGASTTNIKATSIKLGIGFDYSMWDRTGLVTGAIMTTDPACELRSEGVIMKESYDVEDMFFGTMTMLDEFTGLEPATKYYFRSFIKRGEEYKLGEIKSVTTLGPAASYVAVTDMMDGRLVLDLNVQRDDASKFTIGIEYAFDEKFTDGAKKMNIDRSKDNQSQTAAYRKQLNINMPSTDVYYRFYYAKTGTTDYVYGDTKKFRMLDLTESQIVPAASGITANSVTISGALNTGSYSVAKLSIGVLCAATANPTLETAGVVSSPMQLELDWMTFSYVLAPTTLNGLGSGTTYYYRIYYKVGENVIYLPVHTFETVSAPTTVEVANESLYGFPSGTGTDKPGSITVGDLTLTLAGLSGGSEGNRYAKLATAGQSYLAVEAPKSIKELTVTVESFNGSIYLKESDKASDNIASKNLSGETSAQFTLSGDNKKVYIMTSASAKIKGLSVTY